MIHLMKQRSRKELMVSALSLEGKRFETESYKGKVFLNCQLG